MPSPLGGAGLLSVHSLTAQLPMGELWDQGWGTSALLEFFSLKAPCELCVPASLWGHSHGALLQKGKDLARDMPSQEGACCTAGWPRMGWEVRIYGCALLHLWTALVDCTCGLPLYQLPTAAPRKSLCGHVREANTQ